MSMPDNTDERKPVDASEGRWTQDREHLQRMLVDTLESVATGRRF
jgi:hypothetical protein